MAETQTNQQQASGPELFKKFKAFEARSTSEFSGMIERIKSNRKFISGEQWSSADDKYIAKSRNRITVNVISNQCHSVSNQYAGFPFTWTTKDSDVNVEIGEFFGIDSNRFAIEEALLDCVSFGQGVLAIGSDTDVNGNEVPVIYAVTDPDRVRLDPDSTELDGSDAMEGALIDYRSREWIRINMGEQYLPGSTEKMVCTCSSCSTLVPIITYYWLDTDGCHKATFVNETYAEGSGQTLGIHRIPIFPVWGERSWDGDKTTYIGLIAKSETVQRIVNYSMTQLIERLALSPKPMWKGFAEAFKGLDKYYRRAGTGENTIIPGQRLSNDGTTQLPLPERVDNTVRFEDVQGVVQSTMGLLTSITGVDSKGLADLENEVTATAVMYTAKVFQNNIRHFYSHLKTSLKAMGDTLMVLLGHAGLRVTVVQGPSEYMSNQVAAQTITTLLQNADPSVKPILLKYLLRTQPDNPILTELKDKLDAINQPTQGEMQANQLIEEMKKAIEQKDAQIAQLQQQVQSQNDAYMFELRKMELAHRYDMEDAILKARLSNTPADAEKANAEVAKAELEAEKAAVELDAKKVETAAKLFEGGVA